MSSELDSPDAPVRELTRRLHPSSLLFQLLGHAKPFVIPLLLAFFFAGGDRWERWFAFLVVPAMAFEILRYLTFRYRLEGQDLVLKEGIVFRNVRTIPFARVQNLETRRGVLHRLFGVVDVTVETASGSESEARLNVVSDARLDELRRGIFGAGERSLPPVPATEDAAVTPAPTRARELYRLPLGDSLLLGLSPWRGIAIIAAIAGLGWELELWESESVRDAFGGFRDSLTMVRGLLLGLVGLVLVLGLSMAATAIRLHDFRIERRGSGFRIRSGLLTQHVATLEQRRIQAVTVLEPLVLRLFGRASVKVATAAGTEDVDKEPETRRWLAPVIPRAKLAALLREVDPALDLQRDDWRPIAPGARGRLQFRSCVFHVVLGAALWQFLGLAGLGLAAASLAVDLVLCAKEARRRGYVLTPRATYYRRGVVDRRVAVALVPRVQVVGVRSTPFDRRHDMATLEVDTAASGAFVEGIEIPYLEREAADAARAWLADRVEHVAVPT